MPAWHHVAAALRRAGLALQAPTLLIVGGLDGPVIDLSRLALARLPGGKDLVIVPGAAHLLEEADMLDEVVRLATRWFAAHLTGRSGLQPTASS